MDPHLAVNWYALRSKPNKEDFLVRQCKAQDLNAYCPSIRVRVANPRARKVRPYFPGYIFVQVNLEQIGRSFLQWLPGAAGLVSFGGEPASIVAGVINAIRKYVDEVNASEGEALKEMGRGEAVLIQAGPFAGHEAIFDACLSGEARVRVLLNLINKQQIPLELPSSQIQFKKSRGAWPPRST